jgi:hypothetical protein
LGIACAVTCPSITYPGNTVGIACAGLAATNAVGCTTGYVARTATRAAARTINNTTCAGLCAGAVAEPDVTSWTSWGTLAAAAVAVAATALTVLPTLLLFGLTLLVLALVALVGRSPTDA